MRLVFLGCALAAALALAPTASATSISNLSVSRGSDTAGAFNTYTIDFTATTAISAGSGSTITLDASVGAPDTNFSGNKFDYFITNNDTMTGYAVLDDVTRSNGNATVTIPLGPTGAANIGAGDSVTVLADSTQNPTDAGSGKSLRVHTSGDTSPVTSSSYTINPDTPSNINTVGQNLFVDAEVGQPVSPSFSVEITDQYGNPTNTSGVTITWTAPSSGPSGTFADTATNTDTEVTNSSGDATASTYTTNTMASYGLYQVPPTAPGYTNGSFYLNNTPGPVDHVLVNLAPDVIAANGTSMSTATATVEDQYGNNVLNEVVNFGSSGSQTIGSTTDNGDGTHSAPITSTTTPEIATITATDTTPNPDVSGMATLYQALAPNVTTGAASDIATTSAMVAGTVNPNAAATMYKVEYGTSTAYGMQTPEQSLPAGTATQSVSTSLTGLFPGMEYHYRYVATNGIGTTNGPDQTLMTASEPVPVPEPGPGPGPGPGPNGPTDGNDILNGTPLGELICGLLGNDLINGLGGDDTLFGDACNDVTKASAAQVPTDGDDRINGGDGNDKLYGAGGKDSLNGGRGNDKLFGGGGNDSLKGEAGKDALDGGAGNDKLDGGRDKNTYKAGAGNDSIKARNGQKETVDCGSGRKDSATVDRNDKVKGCEKVKRKR